MDQVHKWILTVSVAICALSSIIFLAIHDSGAKSGSEDKGGSAGSFTEPYVECFTRKVTSDPRQVTHSEDEEGFVPVGAIHGDYRSSVVLCRGKAESDRKSRRKRRYGTATSSAVTAKHYDKKEGSKKGGDKKRDYDYRRYDKKKY